MADLPKPCMWTLSETVATRQTTSRGFLWFGNPKNSGWEPLFTADQLRDYAAAAVAEERERCAHVCKGIAAGHAGDARRLQDLPATHAAGMRDGANQCAAAIRGTEAPHVEVTGLGRNRSNDER